MSTSCEIRIQGCRTAKVYKHWDGYPSATLPWLQKFNMNFAMGCGDDPAYKLAQLLRSSAFDAKEFDLDDSREAGWGVVPYRQKWDVEYIYTLNNDGSVSVKEL